MWCVVCGVWVWSGVHCMGVVKVHIHKRTRKHIQTHVTHTHVTHTTHTTQTARTTHVTHVTRACHIDCAKTHTHTDAHSHTYKCVHTRTPPHGHIHQHKSQHWKECKINYTTAPVSHATRQTGTLAKKQTNNFLHSDTCTYAPHWAQTVTTHTYTDT